MSYRKYNFPYILVRHKKYLAATGVLKDLAPARYFFTLNAAVLFELTMVLDDHTPVPLPAIL